VSYGVPHSEVLALSRRSFRQQLVCIRTVSLRTGDVIDIFASLFREGDRLQPMEMPRAIVRHAIDPIRYRGVTMSSDVRHPEFIVHTLGKMIRRVIDRDLTAPSTEVTMVWGNRGTTQKRVGATVASIPFKEDNRVEPHFKAAAYRP
jgi:vanillate/3-O-methylgallate O-demethylase